MQMYCLILKGPLASGPCCLKYCKLSEVVGQGLVKVLVPAVLIFFPLKNGRSCCITKAPHMFSAKAMVVFLRAIRSRILLLVD